MKRPKTYNVTFTVNTDGSATVGDAFVLRKYNQYRRELMPLTKRQRAAALKTLTEVVWFVSPTKPTGSPLAGRSYFFAHNFLKTQITPQIIYNPNNVK